jgi:biotin carboxylase
MVADVSKILLVLPSQSYRNQAFFEAAQSLGADITVVTNAPYPAGIATRVITAVLDDDHLELTADHILAQAGSLNFDAVLGVDDSSTLLASHLAQRLGLPSNSPLALLASSNKISLRQQLTHIEAPQPRWLTVNPVDLEHSVYQITSLFGDGPVVVKPSSLSQSRGVIRADSPQELRNALEITAAINARYGRSGEDLLIESYIDGTEVVLEGMLNNGSLTTIAIFDKPIPLLGPFFEETIYITPTELTTRSTRELHRILEQSCGSLGLTTGPIHAEFRITDSGRPYLIELAARTIGGLCAQTLRFSTGDTLERLVLLNALGVHELNARQGNSAAGVVMLPTPRSGVFCGVENLDDLKSIPFVEEVDITASAGSTVFAPPYSDQYLGFVFVRAPGRQAALISLRRVVETARISIEPLPA